MIAATDTSIFVDSLFSRAIIGSGRKICVRFIATVLHTLVEKHCKIKALDNNHTVSKVESGRTANRAEEGAGKSPHAADNIHLA